MAQVMDFKRGCWCIAIELVIELVNSGLIVPKTRGRIQVKTDGEVSPPHTPPSLGVLDKMSSNRSVKIHHKTVTVGGCFVMGVTRQRVPRSSRYVRERVRPIPPKREVGGDSRPRHQKMTTFRLVIFC